MLLCKYEEFTIKIDDEICLPRTRYLFRTLSGGFKVMGNNIVIFKTLWSLINLS